MVMGTDAPLNYYDLIVNEVAFEFFPPHVVVDIAPIAPETEVMPPRGGLNTKTSTVPGCAMFVAVMAATNCRKVRGIVGGGGGLALFPNLNIVEKLVTELE
ncbi:MAG TPA: hypothetical protein VNO32_56285 [Candidatus Acidoferrum sp.]|nr:hypothetical protein [Candidatus Acidoferrum sp.]